MSNFSSLVEKRVLILTYDGRTLVGTLAGYDQTGNCILADSIERMYSADEPVEEQQLGLYILRGDNVAILGEIDIAEEAKIDFSSQRAEPLTEIAFV